MLNASTRLDFEEYLETVKIFGIKKGLQTVFNVWWMQNNHKSNKFSSKNHVIQEEWKEKLKFS